MPKVCSLSALRRSFGRNGRCSRQKATYGFVVVFLVGGAAGAGARTDEVGTTIRGTQLVARCGGASWCGKGCWRDAGSAAPLCPPARALSASHCWPASTYVENNIAFSQLASEAPGEALEAPVEAPEAEMICPSFGVRVGQAIIQSGRASRPYRPYFRHGASTQEKGTAAAWRMVGNCFCPASMEYSEDTRSGSGSISTLRFRTDGGQG